MVIAPAPLQSEFRGRVEPHSNRFAAEEAISSGWQPFELPQPNAGSRVSFSRSVPVTGTPGASPHHRGQHELGSMAGELFCSSIIVPNPRTTVRRRALGALILNSEG